MWGATPVTESVAEVVTERTGVPLAAGLRRQRAAGDRLQPGRRARPPGGSTPPACRPPGVELRVVDLDTGAVLAPGRDRRDPGPQPVGDGRLPARRGQRRRVRRRLVPHRRRRLARARGLGPPHRPLQGDDQGQRLPGGTGRGRGGAARPPRRRSTARCSASPTSGPARCPWPPCSSTPTQPVADGELERLVADSLATYKQLRHVVVVDTIPRLPSGKVLRRTLRDEWAPLARRRRQRRTDGRPPLPRAAGAARLGRPGRRPARPRTPSASSTTPSGPPSSTPPSPPSGWRELRTATDDGAPWASGVEVAHRRRGARPRPRRRRRSSARPWPPSCAASPAHPPATEPETVALAARPVDAGLPARGRRRPAAASPSTPAGATAALRARPGGRRPHARRRSPWRRSAGGVDLTRPHRRARPGGAGRAGRRPDAGRSPTTTIDALDRPRPGADLRPTSSAPCAARSSSPPTTPRSAGSTARPIGSFQAVQHLLADAFVATEGSRSVALHAAWAVDALPARRRARRRRGRQGVLRPGRPHACARPPSRCTAASATPGSAWPTCTCGGRCCRATSSAAPAPTSARVLDAPRHDRRRTMDFGDSPDEAAFRARLRDVAGRQQPRPAGVVDLRRLLGRAGGVAPVALRRRVLRPVVARPTSAARACRASTT